MRIKSSVCLNGPPSADFYTQGLYPIYMYIILIGHVYGRTWRNPFTKLLFVTGSRDGRWFKDTKKLPKLCQTYVNLPSKLIVKYKQILQSWHSFITSFPINSWIVCICKVVDLHSGVSGYSRIETTLNSECHIDRWLTILLLHDIGPHCTYIGGCLLILVHTVHV